jgi:hypothetical protein
VGPVTFYCWGLDRKLTALKVPRLCLLVLLVKVCWGQGRVLRSEGGKVTGSRLFEYAIGEGSWKFRLNFVFRRQHYEEMLITFRRLRLDANPKVNIKKETTAASYMYVFDTTSVQYLTQS